MNILIIASYLPIGNYSKHNTFVYDYAENYYKHFPNDNITIIRPVIFIPWFLKFFSKRWNNYYKIRKTCECHERGFKVVVLPYFSIRRIKYLDVYLSKSLYFFNKNKISKIIKSFDIIHAQELMPDGLLANRIYRNYDLPYILTVRKIQTFLKYTNSRNSVFKILEKASKITTLNVRNIDILEQNGFDNAEIITHGVSESFFYRREYVKPAKFKILSVGSLIKLKNFDKVIVALSKMIDKFNFSYTIYGDGEEKSNLVNLVKSLKMEDIISFQPNVSYQMMPDVYKNHDIFILISQPETFGRVYIEAMASSMPIICAKNSGIDGLFENRVDGFSVDLGNTVELANVLTKLMTDKDCYNQISSKSYLFAKKHTWNSVTQTYNNIYKISIKNFPH